MGFSLQYMIDKPFLSVDKLFTQIFFFAILKHCWGEDQGFIFTLNGRLHLLYYESTLHRKSPFCLPFLGIARPQRHFQHAFVCERFTSI
jgi:hypothetical protein